MKTHINKAYFPLHLDSGNRGCEGIARGTAEILKLSKDNYVGISRDYKNDLVTNLNLNISYKTAEHTIYQKIIYRIKLKLCKNTEIQKRIIYEYAYGSILNSIENNALTFITGGDMLCYENNQVNYITDTLCSQGKQVILWGCSIGEENLTPEKENILRKFSCITTRESLTYELLKNYLQLNNVFLYPDPAFVLEPEITDLPQYFERDCVGINISNFVGGKVDKDTIYGKNIIKLIDYILSSTNYDVVFIPHVFWPEQDDSIISEYYVNLFKDNDRIHIINSKIMNYCQIRYAISKCKFFLGARTHAMISAYSTCVPSIALGYSIKSKGIAKDLCMPEYSVLDYRNLKRDDEILERFIKLQENEINIRELLSEEMPDYINKAYNAKQCIENLERNK